MRLYYSPTSPYVRKVLMVLQETNQSEGVELVAVSGSPIDPGTMPVGDNPLGKIPTLVTGDGKALFDSRVITRYLDARAGAGLYPEGEALWDVLMLEALADGIADAALMMAYESRARPEEMYHAPWVEGQWGKISRALDRLEAVHLPQLTAGFGIAQIALLAALGYLDLRFEARNWRDGRPGLAAFVAAHAERPSFASTKVSA